MKKTILMLMLAAMSTGAMAEWVVMDRSDEGDIYLDPTTVRKDGDLRRVWQLHDLKKRDKGGYVSVRILMEYDCKGERVQGISFSTHSEPMASGKTLSLINDPGIGWSYIPPGTAGVEYLKFVCDK